jgi:hypothetical protein
VGAAPADAVAGPLWGSRCSVLCSRSRFASLRSTSWFAPAPMAQPAGHLARRLRSSWFLHTLPLLASPPTAVQVCKSPALFYCLLAGTPTRAREFSYECRERESPHPHIPTSSNPHILTSSHLHILTSPHPHILTFSNPHISTSSHPHILTSPHPHQYG